jgi:hypothetical protein
VGRQRRVVHGGRRAGDVRDDRRPRCPTGSTARSLARLLLLAGRPNAPARRRVAPQAITRLGWAPRVFGDACCAKSFRNGTFWVSAARGGAWQLAATIGAVEEGAGLRLVAVAVAEPVQFVKFRTSGGNMGEVPLSRRACNARHATRNRATRSAQRTACDAQHATRHVQHATRHVQHATRHVQHATRNAQHATRHVQHAMRNVHHATRHVQHAMRNVHHATRNVQHATRNVQHATSNMQRATYNMQRATYNMQRATYTMQRATYNMQRAACNAQHATRHAQVAELAVFGKECAADYSGFAELDPTAFRTR